MIISDTVSVFFLHQVLTAGGFVTKNFLTKKTFNNKKRRLFEFVETTVLSNIDYDAKIHITYFFSGHESRDD